VNVLQLICHHTYDTWRGLPIDRSAYGRSNGTSTNTQFHPDGARPGSGALKFGRRSQVNFSSEGAWQGLGAISIQVVANLDFLNPIPTSPRFLVHGDKSFRLAERFPVGLEGTIMGPSGAAVTVTSEPPFSPDGLDHSVPANRWSTLGFSYDGFSTMEVTIDGVVVGRRSASVPIPPVGPEGVSIGADVNGDNALLGRIDEIKIWRRDPEVIEREFLCRKWDAAAVECWQRVFGAIAAAFSRHPREMQALMRTTEDVLFAQLRRITAAGPAALAELRGVLERYSVLWCRGDLDSDAMQAVFRDFVRWWRRHVGGDPELGNEADQAIYEELQRLVGPVDFRCDPAFLALQSRITAALQAAG
jgi:hypothetical protein